MNSGSNMNNGSPGYNQSYNNQSLQYEQRPVRE